MKRFFFCVSLVLTGLMTSCVDKYEEVDADSKPSWLGGSIYSELKNPNPDRLTGTFVNYLRLIDDLGYAETLNRTGSKTVFPANDEAFERFFNSNEWGVSSYEQLTISQKKLLLYSSMLDNALLLGMLPTASNGTAEPALGEALKHATNVSVIDTIQFLSRLEDMPQGNPYWTRFAEANKGIHVVSDNTRPMMIHLTREYMLHNDIQVAGEESDFAVLTGSPYTEGTAYVFNNRVINGDVTCQNGYIHQMENVLVPPGNMAQVLRKHENTRYFSRILDHYAAPYYDATTTRLYNDWAKTQAGVAQIDSIFQVRYLSTRSQGGASLTKDPNGSERASSFVLNLDPGWNQYYPATTGQSKVDNTITDIAAFFVPDDEAVKQFFLPGGGGAYLIDLYGSMREQGTSVINDEAHLMENLDSLHAKKPEVLAAFTRNLLKPRFTQTVPSKFGTVTNDAQESMGLTLDVIDKKADGKYDITIANNGVVYVIKDMFVPAEFNSVMAPASVYPDMSVIGWAIKDWKGNDPLGLDFHYYLLAMSANYAFFIPENDAFNYYYVDPASLGHKTDGGDQLPPDVLHFYYDSESSQVKCYRYYFDTTTGQPYGNPREASISQVKSQFQDILNYHTLVLKSGERIGENKYYKTKHGGEIKVEPVGNNPNNQVGWRILSGAQIEDPNLYPAPVVKEVFDEKNGYAYRMSRLIQPPHKSVYAVLKENEQFSEFLDVCTGFQSTEIMSWAGISDKVNPTTGSSEQDVYTIFTNQYKIGTDTETKMPVYAQAAIDYNVKMFNTYNYTLFAPDNTAMAKAYKDGLPKWSTINGMYQKFIGKMEAYNESKAADDPDYEPDAEDKKDMAAAKKMMTQLRDFVRYHFLTNSVYADKTIETGRYQSLCAGSTGVSEEAVISGGNDRITVTDLKGHSVTVDANDSGRIVNKMTRDYWMGNGISAADAKNATAIYTSSFCAVHQISEPLYNNKSGRFDQ